MRVFGIDVVKGSVRSRSRRPVYALVRMDDGEILGEQRVTRFRLLKDLAAEKPDILAVDSIQEIARDQHELYAFLQALPAGIRLVQVTGGERPETLGKVAARYNISFDRLDPADEARTIARIASLGGGSEVVAFENATDVVVSRHRSIGKGGWSQNRYTRKIHGAVLSRAREIEDLLSSAGLRCTKKETRAFGGASRVVFQVPAPRELVPVPSHRGTDVQVRVSGRKADRIRFRPLEGGSRYLVVGIDPGTTTAIAALDLDGKVVHLSSSRQRPMSEVIEALYRAGKPLVIASDVKEMPFSVERIRRAFSAVGYTPREDRTVEEKAELVAGLEYGNIHERDALAAAIDAFRYYRNRLQNALRRVPPGVDLDRVRAGIIRGRSLEQVLGGMKPARPEKEEAAAEPVPGTLKDERVMVLDGTVKRLKAYVAELQEEVKARDRALGRLRERQGHLQAAWRQQLRRDAEIVRRDSLIQDLRRRLRKEERKNRAMHRRIERMRRPEAPVEGGGGVPVKVLESLTRDAVQRLETGQGIDGGDLLAVAKTAGWGRSVIRDLAERGVRALIVPAVAGQEPDPQLVAVCRELPLPLLSEGTVGLRLKGKTGSADPRALDEAFRRWEEGQKEREREEKKAMVEYIFREYRTEREKEVRKGG
ncbi:MAG: DUF460 domain-containing protein [Methanomicrobiales archaeon]|nr:DUF460 domain-containing protein [Methanomicrobiales archaeon]MDD1655685.1 DUF460 domain-containing protein [Methanomicrobiales archaeon]